MAITIYYSAPENFSEDSQYKALMEHIGKFSVHILTGKENDDTLDKADGVIAELSEPTPQQITRAHYVAAELGKPALWLASKWQAPAIDESLKGLSKINPGGIWYGNFATAKSAASIFLVAHLGLPLPSEFDVVNKPEKE